MRKQCQELCLNDVAGNGACYHNLSKVRPPLEERAGDIVNANLDACMPHGRAAKLV